MTIVWCCGFAGKYVSGTDVLVRRSIEERKAKSFRQPQLAYEKPWQCLRESKRETHSNRRNSRGCNSKLQSADYYDRVSRGVYVQSGFEPDKFGRTGAASLANLNFSNLKQRRYGFPRTRTAEWTIHFDQVSP
jgi:hypothetical protein